VVIKESVPLVISHSSCLEEVLEPVLLHRLQKLNSVTGKDSFPLPWIDDTLDMLARATWFSTLDLKSSYWQVDLHLDDKEKTAQCVKEYGSSQS
jgi:hypothetical protein